MSSRLPTGGRARAAPRTLDESGYGEGVADVVKTSGGGAWKGGMLPRTLDESGYGEGVADVVKTSDGAACKGGAPNS